MKTQTVSPIDLKVGDRVLTYGAIVEVMHITTREDKVNPGGIRIAACTSRLVGEDMGAIPRGYFDTPERLVRSGCKFAHALPPGLYWNVQGNALARVEKIIG